MAHPHTHTQSDNPQLNLILLLCVAWIIVTSVIQDVPFLLGNYVLTSNKGFINDLCVNVMGMHVNVNIMISFILFN